MAITTRSSSKKGTLYLYNRVPKRFASVEASLFRGRNQVGPTLDEDEGAGANQDQMREEVLR